MNLNYFPFFFMAFCLFFNPPIFAQDDTPDYEEEEAVVMPPRKPINNRDQENWLFAGGSIIAATLAIIFVACNAGSAPPSNQAPLSP